MTVCDVFIIDKNIRILSHPQISFHLIAISKSLERINNRICYTALVRVYIEKHRYTRKGTMNVATCGLPSFSANRIALDFGPWSEWSTCNGTICGGLGTQKRIRRCMAINCPDEVQETVCRHENENCIG